MKISRCSKLSTLLQSTLMYAWFSSFLLQKTTVFALPTLKWRPNNLLVLKRLTWFCKPLFSLTSRSTSAANLGVYPPALGIYHKASAYCDSIHQPFKTQQMGCPLSYWTSNLPCCWSQPLLFVNVFQECKQLPVHINTISCHAELFASLGQWSSWRPPCQSLCTICLRHRICCAVPPSLPTRNQPTRF